VESYVHLRVSHGVSFIRGDQGLLWARVAKRVVLGMNSWQTRVLLSKKEVTQSALSSLFQPIAMEVTPDDEARPPRPCVRCVTLSVERASEFA